MIEATNESQPRELIPAGNQIARCYSMIHIGTNMENILGTDKILNKVRVSWEIPGEMRVFKEGEPEQPMVIDKEYTLSMHEKSNLRRDLESWRGKGFTEEESKLFDITVLIGKPCLLNIIHKPSAKGKVYSNIAGITNIMKDMKCPDQINPTFEFNYTDKFDPKAVEELPDFIKDKIKTSDEYLKCTDALMHEAEDYNQASPDDSNFTQEADDLPF